MNKIKKGLVTLISCLLVATYALPVAAEDEVEKKESVYTVLNTDGSVKSITVSDTLHSDSGFSDYKDTSDLSNVQNLKSNDEVVSTSGGYVWNTTDTDIYYQGTSTKDLPLTTSISYKLDGTAYTADELVGKSGHLVITIKVSNSLNRTYTVNGKTYNLVTPFVVGLGGMFDEDVFKNVKVSSGKVTSDSSHSIVVGVMLPGLKKGLSQVLDSDLMHKLEDYLVDEVTIESDVENFESPTMMLAAATSTDDLKEEFSDIDELSSIFDQLDDLKEATQELIDGTQSLYDGAVKLNDGVSTLKDGANTLNSGASTLYDGANQVSAGATTLYNGLSTVSSNSAAINSGIQQVADAVLSTVNSSLNESGFESITWSNYDTKLKEYIGNITDEEIANAKAQIKEKAGGDKITDEVLNALIYMAATNTDSSKTFEEKVAAAGATLTQANTISSSNEFKTAYALAQAGTDSILANKQVETVLTAIRSQSAANPSTEALDSVYSAVVNKVATATKQEASVAAIILAYACEHPINEDVLGTDNITNAATEVAKGTMPSGKDDPRNDEKVVAVLKARYKAQAELTDLSTIYSNIISTLVSAGVAETSAPLVFTYGVTKHGGAYDATKDTPTAYFTEYSADLTTVNEANTQMTNSTTDSGKQIINATLTAIVAETLDSSLTPVLKQLTSVATLVEGVKNYTAGVDQCTSGAKTLSSGASQVSSGAKQLKEGTDSLVSGINTLKDGSNTLMEGAKTLNEGMQKYNAEGISKLTDNSRISSIEEASDLLSAIMNDSDNYNNYSGISDGTTGSIKFIFKVSSAAKKASDDSSETTTEKTSFWQRIINLFNFSK